jgi:hypothetical protein
LGGVPVACWEQLGKGMPGLPHQVALLAISSLNNTALPAKALKLNKINNHQKINVVHHNLL